MRLLLLLLLPLWAHATEITCSHVQACNLIAELNAELTLRPLLIQGDPHHYEPPPNDLRSLISAPYLVVAPVQLHPWIRPVLSQRQKNLELAPRTLTFHAQARLEGLGLESQAHFWLIPDARCEFLNQLKEKLKEWRLNTKDLACRDLGLELLETRVEQSSKKIPLILAHDALAPYLTSRGYDHFILRGSDHGEQLKPQTLKDLTQFLAQHPQVIWIDEKGITLPQSLERFHRPVDRKIAIDLLGVSGQPSLLPLKSFLLAYLREQQK